ncbi:lipase 3-like [Sitodiplosis mosellana]|uniref:lipase 3-like n=1 Tax=Sitodiplosis mosellana TaxID=263140 RepID=UPI002443CFB9|nr:lipase 3-like [Sitodiplosis mosellana]
MNLATEAGIPIECHYVATEDGYNLRLYRLPPEERNTTDGNHLRTMFLMHGLLASSPMYITYLEHSAVWIANARGNSFSRNHTKLNPDEEQFWEFSWHEIGFFDLPAMIDYVLMQTGQKQLIYIGHSQGVTSAFVMLSERPEYNEKIAFLVFQIKLKIFQLQNLVPAGCSYRQFIHYGQLATSGRFQKFDYGSTENLKLYGTPNPPEYNYSNIKTKIHIMYGTHDYLVMQKVRSIHK